MERVVKKERSSLEHGPPEKGDQNPTPYQGTIDLNERILKEMRKALKGIKPSSNFGKPGKPLQH